MAEAQHPQPVSLAGLRVFVVEDHDWTRQVLAGFIRDEGAEVEEHANGTQALLAAEGQEPDIILADVMMPSMDGYSMLQHLRKRGHQMPVVFISGHQTARDRAGELRAAAFVPKPASRTTVIDTLRRVAPARGPRR